MGTKARWCRVRDTERNELFSDLFGGDGRVEGGGHRGEWVSLGTWWQ